MYSPTARETDSKHAAGLLLIRVLPWLERLSLLRVLQVHRPGLAAALDILARCLAVPGEASPDSPEASWRCLGAGARPAALKPHVSLAGGLTGPAIACRALPSWMLLGSGFRF